jgi:anaerobic selenocysteine-containing dehydrogenase
MNSVSRRSFLKTAGVAAGAAAISAQSAVAAVSEPEAVQTTPTLPIPREPVIAIVRDGARGEVTVLSGTTEKTYTDRQLVRRILNAAVKNGIVAAEGVE